MPRALWSLRLLLIFSILLVPSFAFPHHASADTGSASDDFNRADGGLGSAWAAVSDGGMSISSQRVIGVAGATTGDIRTGETYGSDQFSQVEVTSTQLSGGQWVGPAVRLQNGGQNGYAGIYFWNFGSPQLMLFVRKAGGWQQLGATGTGPLTAGTQLRITAAGSTISLSENGVQKLSASDATVTGGAPGIVAHENSTADNWTGGGADSSGTGGSGGTASYSVGGTVSGLSGTVVLQDNGGDDLSVDADGPFTFATSVAGGAGYQVTVKTNPSGQACTVSNGSGTVSGSDVTGVTVACADSSGSGSGSSGGSASDDFNRADGGLGSAWAAVSDGGMSISSQRVIGVAGATTGDIRTGETYGSDQFSQVEVTSTQLSGGQWVGPAVRLQNGGQNGYAGIYFWNFGSPQLMLFVRKAGGWQQLGATGTGPLTAGTQLRITAAGSTISLSENGVQKLSASDATVTGGAPGIVAHENSTADNWTGGGADSSGTGGSGGTASYSVGGTVSGLSGTVVLQDNGGDDLSVDADGPFTFATSVAGGAGYQVTVKTNPSGQACTVSNGSGTVFRLRCHRCDGGLRG